MSTERQTMQDYPDALAKLPEAERKDWLALWDEVDALIRKAGETKPR